MAAQQVGDGGGASEVEELLRHSVEHPSDAGDDQHEPVIRVSVRYQGCWDMKGYCSTDWCGRT